MGAREISVMIDVEKVDCPQCGLELQVVENPDSLVCIKCREVYCKRVLLTGEECKYHRMVADEND